MMMSFREDWLVVQWMKHARFHIGRLHLSVRAGYPIDAYAPVMGLLVMCKMY